ncbi:hypothetical protein ACFSJ3_11505 [Corallincola platygyrae]|uniref:DUF3261 domain-containing protein n=1 Tax=Corallincola platygyrae TaxID=1193278 RepID=A0ABW4XQ48_9GAMM
MTKLRQFTIACVALFSLLVVGCASVPLSTMVKMSQFGPEQFVELDGNALRAKVTVEEAVGLKPEQTRLAVTIASPQGEFTKEFDFKLVSETPVIEKRLFRDPLYWRDYELKLSQQGYQTFQEFQQLVKADPQLDSLSLSVGARLKNPPPEGEVVTLSIALKLYEQEDYMPLFDKAEVKMGRTEL